MYLRPGGSRRNFRTSASSQGEFLLCKWCAKYACLCLYELQWTSLLFLCWMRSVMAWCYVTTLEVSQALRQTLFRGQCRWKNFSLWRKQTAHWLCSLLSGCINRPLTSPSVTPFPLSEAHHGRCCSPNSHKLVISLQEMCSNQFSYKDTFGHQTSFPSFIIHTSTKTNMLHVVWPGLIGPMKLSVFLSSGLKTTQGWKSHLARSLVWSQF